jgi:hypothetical protein
VRELAWNTVWQCVVAGRLTALPFELVHLIRNIFLRGTSRRDGIVIIGLTVERKFRPRQTLARMGASREATVAIT